MRTNSDIEVKAGEWALQAPRVYVACGANDVTGIVGSSLLRLPENNNTVTVTIDLLRTKGMNVSGAAPAAPAVAAPPASTPPVQQPQQYQAVGGEASGRIGVIANVGGALQFQTGGKQYEARESGGNYWYLCVTCQRSGNTGWMQLMPVVHS